MGLYFHFHSGKTGTKITLIILHLTKPIFAPSVQVGEQRQTGEGLFTYSKEAVQSKRTLFGK